MVLSSKGDVLTGFSCLSALIFPPFSDCWLLKTSVHAVLPVEGNPADQYKVCGKRLQEICWQKKSACSRRSNREKEPGACALRLSNSHLMPLQGRGAMGLSPVWLVTVPCAGRCRVLQNALGKQRWGWCRCRLLS